jgi:hypothetical protein
VRSTTIVKSPSSYLTAALVRSLRASTFQTEIYDCRTVAGEVRVTGTFLNNRFTLTYRAPSL